MSERVQLCLTNMASCLSSSCNEGWITLIKAILKTNLETPSKLTAEKQREF